MEKSKVFDKEWFKKHQKVLVLLINSWLGRLIFRYRKMGHYPTGRIVGITPNSITEFIGYEDEPKDIKLSSKEIADRILWLLKNPNEPKYPKKRVKLKQHFFTRNEYARKLYFVLLPMWWAMHAWDILFANNFAPQLNFGFDSLTVNPQAGAGGGNVSCDSDVTYSGADSSWATLRGQATGTSASSSDTIGKIFKIAYGNASFGDHWVELTRSIFTFDTSSLTASATITAAVLSIYGIGKSDGLVGTPNIDIYTSSPADNANIVVADFDQIGTTSQTGSPIAYADWNTAGYNDFTFNATGRGNISKTGVSPFGARNANYDVTGTEPPQVQNEESNLRGNYADNASNKPKLVITYTLPVTSNFFLMF